MSASSSDIERAELVNEISDAGVCWRGKKKEKMEKMANGHHM
jgi:hypothetical protein